MPINLKDAEGTVIVYAQCSAVLHLDRAVWARMSEDARRVVVAENVRAHVKLLHELGGDEEIGRSFVDSFEVNEQNDD